MTSLLTVSPSPHVRSGMTTQKIMLLVVLALEKFVSPKPTACIHCGRCVHACPLRLMPTEIAKAFRQKDSEALGKLKVTLCMNCGCCTYACPAKRPVAETNQLAKAFYMSSIKK